MNKSNYQEYRLTIKGPSAFDLTNHLSAEYGWVFSSVGQTGYFEGYAIGYCPTADARNFEGFAISTDQTRIDRLDPIEEK